MKEMRTTSAAILVFGCLLPFVSCNDSTTELVPETRGTGLVTLPPDQYNAIPLAPSPFSGLLPAIVDWSSKMPVPGDQGQQSSCVAWAVGYALKSYQEAMERNWPLAQFNHQFSPAFIYNQLRTSCNSGIVISNALNLIHAQGCASLAMMAYDPYSCDLLPNATQRNEAAQYTIDSWARVNQADLLAVKEQLAGGYPVVLGLHLDKDFERLSSSNPVWGSNNSEYTAFHAVCAVGYDDYKQAFKAINSWGANFGDKGYFWITYNLFPLRCVEAYVAYDDLEALNVPIAVLSANKTIVSIGGEKVTFDASGSHDPGDSQLTAYKFDYGDGHVSDWVQTSVVTATYEELGRYFAMVRVRNKLGVESIWSNQVRIDAKGSIAHFDFGTVPNHLVAGRTFTVRNNSAAPITLQFEATEGRLGARTVPRCVCFSFDPWEDVTLLPGQFRTVSVDYSPSVSLLSACCPLGLQTATLTVKYSDGSIFGTVTMQGIGEP